MNPPFYLFRVRANLSHKALKRARIVSCSEGGPFPLVNDNLPIYGAKIGRFWAVEKKSGIPSASTVAQLFWWLLRAKKGPFLGVLCQSAEFDSNSAVPERVVVFDASNGKPRHETD